MGPLSKLGCLLFCNILHSSLLKSVECLLIEPLCGGRIRSGRLSPISMQKSNADLAVDSFEKSWIENKIVAKSVKHTSFDWVCGSLRGLQATTSQYKQGTTVLQVPVDAALSAPDTGMEGCPSGLEDLWKDLKGTSRVSLLLMKEWLSVSTRKDNKSKLATYVGTLPAPGSLGTPFHWSEEYLTSFPYKPLVKSVNLQRKRWTELYSRVEKTNNLSGVSYDRFVWAMEMVRSRAFTGLGSTGRSTLPLAGAASAAFLAAAVALSKTSGVNEAIPIALGTLGALCFLPALLSSTESSCVLLPAIDSSNHDGSNPLCNIALEPSRGSFLMIANRNIVVGEQITISYGDRNNDDLLQYFGFVEVNCAFDRYVVLDPLSALKAELTLQISEMGSSPTLVYLLKSVEMALVGNVDNVTSTGSDTDAKRTSLIVNRNAATSWDLGALKLIKSADQLRCIGIILASEKRRLNLGLSDIPNQEAMPEFNPCIVRTFLNEKINVLNVASALAIP